MDRSRRRGVALLELLVAISVFSLLTGLAVALFLQAIAIWRRTSSSDDARRQLRRARSALERDAVLASPSQMGQGNVTAHLPGAGKDGPSLWFLSPLDGSGTAVYKQDGSRMWQRNILYYLVVPAQHRALYGFDCSGGVATNGYDDRCPHKVLIRKVIDSGPPTTLTDESSEEVLLADVTPYLTQPQGLDVGSMKAEPGVEDVKVVAVNLLTLEITSAPPPQQIPLERLVALRALSILQAGTSVSIGGDPLYDSAFTQREVFSVFLRN